MAVVATQTSVESTAPSSALVDPGLRSVANPLTVTVQVLTASVDVYFGGSDVATTTGIKLTSTDGPKDFVLGAGDKLYARTASGTATVAVLKTGA